MDVILTAGGTLTMSMLDIARGAYTRLPNGWRRAVAPVVALLPTRAKFGPQYQFWRDRIALADRDPQFAATEHLASLRRLLTKAQQGSPFYGELFERHFGSGFDPSTATPDDLRRLPVLRKQALIAAGDAVLAAPRSTVDTGDTSGSNGEKPFRFYLDKDRSAREIAFVYDAWSATGFTERDAKIVLRGVGLDPSGRKLAEWEPALKELRLSAFPLTRQDASLYIDLIDQHQVRYLYGYPSAIDLLCRHMLELGRRPKLDLLGVLPISEPLYPHQRRTIATALGDTKVSHFYGLSEKALFARELVGPECVYEFNPLYGLAELVDDNDQPITTIGQEGRLVGTGFLSTGMPFIRYDTEDRTSLVQQATAENGYRLRVGPIVPRRKPGYLITACGDRLVTVDFTPDTPRFFKGISEYQFYQDEPGKCTIRYIPDDNGTEQDALNIASDLGKRSLGKIDFAVQRVDSLGAGRAGKRAFIDQRLDISLY